MTRWQRGARAAFGIFALVFAGVLYFSIEERKVPVAAAPPVRFDPQSAVETTGGNVLQLNGARQDVRLEFARQVTYDDGQSKLLEVTAHVENRGGRNFVITGNEAKLGQEQSAIDMFGDVVLKTSDGLTAHAQEAHYLESEGIVRAPGPVTFTRGRMTGSGVGFSYDKQRDTIWLLDQAVVKFAPQGDLQAMDIRSGAAGFAKGERYMRFERRMTLTREGQVVESDDAMVHLFADRDEPDVIELRGHSTITGGTGMGSLRALQGRDVNLDYGEDGRTLEKVAMNGEASIQTATQSGGAGQQLAAEWIDLAMATDGSITSLNGRDNVRLTLPPVNGGAARTVAAAALVGTGAPGQGLTSMQFTDGVTFRETPAGAPQARVAKARRLTMALSPGTGELQDAKFDEAFSFEDGPLRAASASSVYQVVNGVLLVTGRAGNIQPRVADTRMTVDGETIEVTLTPRKLAAQGGVRSVLQAGRESQAGMSLLSAKEAAYVTADKLTFEEESGRGVYSGGARLWQGDTAVQADSISLDDRTGDLTATGQVRSTLALSSATAPAAKDGPKPAPTIARAAEFRYDDAARRATYSKNAQMNGPEGNLSGDRIDLVLGRDENALARLEAAGAVRVLVDKREATGVSLTYHPTDARYVLVGTPVRFLEECRETSGKTLTFFRASDRILIDGNEEARTQSRGGSQCPEPRFQ